MLGDHGVFQVLDRRELHRKFSVEQRVDRQRGGFGVSRQRLRGPAVFGSSVTTSRITLLSTKMALTQSPRVSVMIWSVDILNAEPFPRRRATIASPRPFAFLMRTASPSRTNSTSLFGSSPELLANLLRNGDLTFRRHAHGGRPFLPSPVFPAISPNQRWVAECVGALPTARWPRGIGARRALLEECPPTGLVGWG